MIAISSKVETDSFQSILVSRAENLLSISFGVYGVYPRAVVTLLFVISPRIVADDLFSTFPKPTCAFVTL